MVVARFIIKGQDPLAFGHLIQKESPSIHSSPNEKGVGFLPHFQAFSLLTGMFWCSGGSIYLLGSLVNLLDPISKFGYVKFSSY